MLQPLSVAWARLRRARGCVWAVLAGVGALAGESPRQVYNLPAGDAATTLRQLSEVAQNEILFAAEAVRGVRTNAVQGEFTALEAGNRMLSGTPLVALQDPQSGALAVRRAEVAVSPAPVAAPARRAPHSPAPPPVVRTGGLRGRVYNGATGDNLENAVVGLAGTATSVYTARDGTFALDRLPAGPAALQVTYPGLDDATVSVVIPADGVGEHDIRLTSTIYQLEAVAVSAVREGNAAAIARQEAALTVGNSVSLDAYGNVAKGDMGSFLQRLPGVVGEYGGSAVDAVSVRGLAPAFTTVMLDGIRAASANPSSRSQLVSAMAVDAIESVEVIKTPTADMSADSLGGVVNLRTRSAFDRTGRTIVLKAAATYNETMGRHLDATGQAPILYPNYSLQLADVFEVFGRKLGVSVTGSYQEVGDGLQTVRAEFAGNWDYAGPTVARRFLYADQEFHRNTRASLNTKLDYKLARDSSLTLAAGFQRFRNVMDQIRPQHTDNLILDQAATTADTWVFSRVRYRSNHDFRDTIDRTWRYSLGGKHALAGLKLEWGVTASDSQRPLDRLAATAISRNDFALTYDRRASKEFPILTYGAGVPPPLDRFDNLASVTLAATHEFASNQVRSAKLDATREFKAWRWPATLKAGFTARQEDRLLDSESLSAVLPAGDYSQYRDFSFTHGWVDGRYPATPIIDTQALFADARVGYTATGLAARPALKFNFDPAFFPAAVDGSVASSLLSDYETRETIPAGYVQSEVKFTRRLQMTAGLRLEQTRTKIVSRLDQGARVATPEARYGSFKTVEADYLTWFPNLQFRFEPVKRLAVRANYSTTIGRPLLADLVARFGLLEAENGFEVSFSNPSLQPQESRNFDLSVEYYFKPVGVVSLGVFRKEISNYVTATSFPIVGNEFGLDLEAYAGWTGRTKVNAGRGRVDGMEFNYSHQFSFLPGRWRGLGFMANWTVLTSTGDYNGIISRPLPFRNVLIGLRPRSGNAGLTYQQGRWDLRLMWNHASNYISSLDTADPSNSEFVGAREQWDFFARWKLSRTLHVFVDVINAGEDNRARFRGRPSNDRWAQTNLFPRSITAGMEARF